MARPGSHFPHNSFPLLFLLEDFSWLLDFSISSIFLILFGSTIGYFLQTSATVTKTFLLLAFWLFLCSHLIFLHLPRLDFWLMACFSLEPPFFCSFLGPRLPFSSAESALPISGICSSYQRNLLFLSAESALPISRASFHFFSSAEYVLLTDRIAFSLVHAWLIAVADFLAFICFCAVIPESCSSTLNLAVQP